ncbi:endoplasmic reticulum metallopeptidase 1-like isoform X1 [Anastrepha ludens]|uniref:endoplasmic reticulum metallopeptidase 1-like isoform X1 n=2 Tax=Anastrepha ludens TaxID=28586 RepID=UPI0023B0FB98|nr:endoplasmic reticulum metallopeptidase 1-like isoform X1 [Anastrepha ludens]
MLTLASLRLWWQHQCKRDGLRCFLVFARCTHFCHFLKRKVEPDEAKVPTEAVSPDNMTYHRKQSSKVPFYLAPAFLLFWVVLLFAVVIPIYLTLPEGLTLDNEITNPGQFISERAKSIDIAFGQIGPKVVGSNANENLTVQFVYDRLVEIQGVMLDDLFEMDIDVQVASGAFIHWTMVNMYQTIQNVVVRFGVKNSSSESYLLINSHFDSKPFSPGAGDDGAMVVIMLELLRVLATTRQPFEYPIVFLFNGAEENPLQASHGFITQHKWAKYCKAVINLDSSGSSGREILFQSGPNNPWLVDLYGSSVKRPFATTFAEELFQSGIIPSDTDFRIFKNFGHIPGLDMAHNYNGYVYHTKFDTSDIIPRGNLQNTGDNLLGLVRAFSNCTQLKNPALYAEGNAVFYDFLGFFAIYYTEAAGKIINTSVSVVALVLVVISMCHIGANSFMSIGHILRLFALIFVLHLLGWILAIVLPLLIAVIFDKFNYSMTWFTSKWLILGLYACPTLFGLCTPTLLYLSLSRNDKVAHPFRLQMVNHAHTLILSILCLALTFLGIRSSYFLMISVLFYASSLLINLLTTLNRQAYYWSIFVILSQILPFLYFAYLFNALLVALIPMMGRFGTATNPDLVIGLLTILAIILAMGYLIPLLNIFNHPKTVLLLLPTATVIFALLTLTSYGFPYRPSTNAQRVDMLEVHRVFYEYDGSVSLNESGYYFDFQDRRKHLPLVSYVDLAGLYYVAEDCEKYMVCGLPIYNHRWMKSRKYAAWLPREEPIKLPGKAILTLTNKTVNASTESVRFEFELQGPSHMSIFIQPVKNVTVSGWSFLPEMLEEPATYPPPYHIYFSYGKLSTPLQFYIDLQKNGTDFDVPLMQLGIGAHFIDLDYERDAETKEFLATFPNFTFVNEWPGSYERYIF